MYRTPADQRDDMKEAIAPSAPDSYSRRFMATHIGGLDAVPKPY